MASGTDQAQRSFEDLLAEGEAVDVSGWDFSWFAGRATEERPPWGYARLVSQRMAGARAGLDLQTGGGEVLATIERPPPVLRATESWPPNLPLARAALAPLGGQVLEAPDAGPLPFADASFDLVTARLPVVTPWPEIGRVLAPGGTFLAQEVGPGSNIELSRAMLGGHLKPGGRFPADAVAAAEAAGLEVVDLREARLVMEFFDVAAVVVFLRKVVWTVPDFNVARFRPQLRAVHDGIRATGSFVCHPTRFLIEARRPERTGDGT
ncbi:class I SAM-dependent methyltransferase [Occultella glacieicola]|uniref:Class I SAM-dependent methyltransferase n=1 Tax=Occultella glacieicola TaxID=2518684 RepID=A0ABY2E1R7_9MICO|nr:class I SAM-dependent methyltransferase [Occultella glacieicola]TDE92559.1 class I SAM-dependent methyltransferase [Occultella glacieicola]